MKNPKFLLILYVCLAFRGLAGAQTEQITVNDPRPLSASMDQLQRIVGFAINYEDVPFENIADVQDVSTAEERATTPGFQQIVPRSGAVTAWLQDKAAFDSVDVIGDINLLLTSYRSEKLPGDFNVEQFNDMYYVTPVEVLGSDGKVRQVTSPLAAVITIPTAKRTVEEAIDAIFAAVFKATGKLIVIGQHPFRPGDVIIFGVTNATARDALAKLFSISGKGPLSYRLLFDPIPDRNRLSDYMMNLESAGKTASTHTFLPVGPVIMPADLSGPNKASSQQKQAP